MAQSIMIQGTASNVGKSLLCAGLCRIFKQDGYAVAPFKSQNMALNSAVTPDGLEIGRAQAMQAEAAGVAPTAAMNPILLKPTSDSGSQVIVNGIERGNMTARQYYGQKAALLPEVAWAYASLSAYDIVVIEGAGSPVELNLKKDDFVNMGMAAIANAPVLLVGDIDKGGVFAQLYGTLALLAPEERARVKGLIVNKFRGDISLFDDGRNMLADVCAKPVVGVVPYIDVDIDDEDSLSPRLSNNADAPVAVIRLPRISNFTDFAPLPARYVSKAEALGRPRAIILPGTKNTIADLRWLRESGLEAAIKRLAADGVPVFGICGGYQMLGQSITDAANAEGGGAMDGLGLLPVQTAFAPQKRRKQVSGTVPAWGVSFTGYEIHMGQTALRPGATPFTRLSDGTPDGCISGNTYGTYVHGFFDDDGCRARFLQTLGITEPPAPYAAYRQQQYDRLASHLRAHLDMRLIYGILEGAL